LQQRDRENNLIGLARAQQDSFDVAQWSVVNPHAIALAQKGPGTNTDPNRITVWIAAISPSSTATGVLPTPTKCITPGVTNIGNREDGSKWQNTYPSKRGV
jgi:hypothetical protein